MFADESRPGRTFWKDDVFDIQQGEGAGEGPFYNLPGYLDNFKVQLQSCDLSTDCLTGIYCPASASDLLSSCCLGSVALVCQPARVKTTQRTSSAHLLQHMRRPLHQLETV